MSFAKFESTLLYLISLSVLFKISSRHLLSLSEKKISQYRRGIMFEGDNIWLAIYFCYDNISAIMFQELCLYILFVLRLDRIFKVIFRDNLYEMAKCHLLISIRFKKLVGN